MAKRDCDMNIILIFIQEQQATVVLISCENHRKAQCKFDWCFLKNGICLNTSLINSNITVNWTHATITPLVLLQRPYLLLLN